MNEELLTLRHEIEKLVATLGGEQHGAGTNLITGETDFSFDLNGKAYSVRILELK